MNWREIHAVRSIIEAEEGASSSTAHLYKYEGEFLQHCPGVSVIVPVRNGASEMEALLHSLMSQTINRLEFEVIFSLNGCTDDSGDIIREFSSKSNVPCILIENDKANISQARNLAIKLARFRFATFVDHDDCLSYAYLEELTRLGNYRSIVVSNIMSIENGRLKADYAQEVIKHGFEISNIYRADEIDLCFRAYTLNAIKLAPTYMLKRVSYDESLHHCEDMKYWRDVFHAFMPITVKSPGWRDIYYRMVRPSSASRGYVDIEDWARPRLRILRQIEVESGQYSLGSPQRRYDQKLAQLLRETLAYQGYTYTPPIPR